MFASMSEGIWPLFWISSTPESTTPSTDKTSKTASVAKPALASSNPDGSPVRTNKSRAVTRIPELDKVQVEAKKLEWKLSLEAILKAYTTTETQNERNFEPLEYLKKRTSAVITYLHVLGFATTDDDKEVCQTKAEKLVSELIKYVPTLTKGIVADILRPYFSELGLDNYTHLLDQHATELFQELIHCFSRPDSFEREYDKLEQDIKELSLLIEESHAYLESDPASRYKIILMVLRRALQRPAYLLMRTDEQNPDVHLLHRLVIASIAESETLPAYLKLGTAICDSAKPSIKRIESLGDILTSAREVAANAGFHENDPLVNTWRVSQAAGYVANSIIAYVAARYGLKPIDKEVRTWRTTKIVETLASTISKITDIIELGMKCLSAGISAEQTKDAVINHTKALFFDEAKDYRGTYGNLYSAAWDQTFRVSDDTSVTQRTLIGPSLAQGSKVHPEILALLQALENRRISSNKGEPVFWSYTNLQTRDDGIEGKQTDTIMRLNDRYPLSFDAITLPSDPLPDYKELTEEAKAKMLANLTADEAYTLDKSAKKSSYYFPACDKELLAPIFKDIVDKAYTFTQQPQIDADKKVAFFSNLVHLSIMLYRAARNVSDLMRDDEDRMVLLSFICAVCVDRGMMANMELLYLQSLRAFATAAIDLARGILAKNRLPLEKRVSQIGLLAHDKSVSVGLIKFFDDVKKLAMERQDIHSERIRYLGCPSNDLPQDPIASDKTPKRRLTYEE